MSSLADALPPHPVAIPPELAAAWDWMEAQGHAGGSADEPILTAYAGERVLGPVFTTSLARGWAEAWFGADNEATSRLRPIAEASGDGAVLALWADDAGGTRAVVLGSEGDAYEVARTPLDLLTLLAVGYVDLTDLELGDEPEDEDAVDAVAPFRAWVEATYDVEVPEEWPAVERDAFTTWVRRALGEDVPDSPEPESPDASDAHVWPTELAGDLTVFLDALDTPDGSPQVRALAEVLDVELGDGGLRKAGRALRARGVEVDVERGKLATVFISTLPLGRLVDRVPVPAQVDDVVGLLGEPDERSDEHGWLRYRVGDRHLHLTVEPSGEIGMICLMSKLPWE